LDFTLIFAFAFLAGFFRVVVLLGYDEANLVPCILSRKHSG
jgi:hypothetical protein